MPQQATIAGRRLVSVDDDCGDDDGDEEDDGDESEDESLLHVAPGHGRQQAPRAVRHSGEFPHFGVRRLNLLAVALQLARDFQPDFLGFCHGTLRVGDHVVLPAQPEVGGGVCVRKARGRPWCAVRSDTRGNNHCTAICTRTCRWRPAAAAAARRSWSQATPTATTPPWPVPGPTGASASISCTSRPCPATPCASPGRGCGPPPPSA